MTNLIETMAKAIHWDETPSGGVPWDNLKARDRIAWISPARAALAAIEAAGYRVAPVEPTGAMVDAANRCSDSAEYLTTWDTPAVIRAAIAAAPKVTE